MSPPPASIASAPRKKAGKPRELLTPAVRAGQVFDAGLVAVFLGLVFLLGVFPLKDTDFWWHLKAGDMIRQAGWVPTVDTLTFGAQGHRWVDLHWVFQLLISFGFERFGVVGLNVAKCLITCGAVLLLITSGRHEWPAWATLLAWMPALLVLSGRMYIRPETLTLLYLATDVAILARWDRRPWLAFLLPVVQICWVNTQGLFVFGPFLVGVALLDAATRRGAFAPERRRWWRIALSAAALTGVACLINPYGLAGAVYPIELLGTMSNPIFKQSIGELKPVLTLFAEVGFDLLPLQMHFLTIAVGALSFVVPATWRVVTAIQDRQRAKRMTPAAPETKTSRKDQKPRKVGKPTPVEQPPARPLLLFRLILFGVFSGFSLAATRNSHQFAAVVGTITAWNCAEWVAEIRTRWQRLRNNAPSRLELGPRLVTLAVLAMAIVAVGSGRFYVWSGEGRTIGLGEEPLWFAHAATRFAGGPGMPDRNVGFHNGHPALFEYEWGPEKQVYTDARLEVMGPELYQQYLNLQGKLSRDQPGWSAELDSLGHPSVLVDLVDPTNGGMVASLLGAHGWHCVWFDPIAAVFVDDTYPQIVQAHKVDFLARHYSGEAEHTDADLPTTFATTRALRGVAMSLRGPQARALIALGLDYARRLRTLAPTGVDGFKQAGLLHFFLDPIPGGKPIPRFRLGFDPTIDLSLVMAAYELGRTLEVAPDEGICQIYLAILDQQRGMDEAALPLLERFAHQPDKNLAQQTQKTWASDEAAQLRRRLGATPTTTWANLSELEQLFDRFCREGRATSAANLVEAAHRDDARPWPWADRLATIRLHLGQPARARAVWRAAVGAPPGVQAARVAATYLVEGDFTQARTNYTAAVAADSQLFEAHYGLARLEQEAGHAAAAVAAAQLAEQAAPDERTRVLARQISAQAAPYRQPGPTQPLSPPLVPAP